MNTTTEKTYRVEICLAGDVADAKRVCREFCLSVGLCVAVAPTDFIYAGGSEAGVVVRLINYPKYPSTKTTLWETAQSLAENLRRALYQDSALLVADDKTEWHSCRSAEEK